MGGPEVKDAWFEISNEGWRIQNAGRPLASLIYEAVQNAFDQSVSSVAVQLDGDGICIEDDAAEGFTDPKLAYTVFLTDKGQSAVMRGRHGRGLKELISAMESAVIDTVGFEMRFGSDGRGVRPSKRRRGTRIALRRRSTELEIEQAAETLGRLIPPKGVTVTINGAKVARPRRFAVLSGCLLETVLAAEGVERVVQRETTVTLLKPRTPNDAPHIFEMGLPVQPMPTPWHVDVAQRIPLDDRRDRITDRYRMQILALLFESLVPETLNPEHLKEDWVNEAVARCRLSEKALAAYTKRAFPQRTVLPGRSSANERARQEGANILDVTALSTGQMRALQRVMETSEQFVERRKQHKEKVRAAEPYEQRTVAFLATLAKRLLGKRVKIELVRTAVNAEGIIESATFDRKRMRMTINVEGKMDLRRPLSPETLGIFFHELAHAYTAKHDLEFIGHHHGQARVDPLAHFNFTAKHRNPTVIPNFQIGVKVGRVCPTALLHCNHTKGSCCIEYKEATT